MPARRTLALSVAVLIVAGACSGSSSHHASPSTTAVTKARKPNVVFVLVDDMDMSEIGYLPTVRKLIAAQGMSLDDYYISNSLCCPSRTTMLRGEYAHDTGVHSNAGPSGGFGAAFHGGDTSSTIGDWMQSAGYATALFGKFLNGYPGQAGRTYQPSGWTDWGGAIDSAQAYGEYNYNVIRNGKVVHYGKKAVDYGSTVYTGYAKNFIARETKQNKPFFMYLAYFAPHQPATPAPRDLAKFANATAPRPPSFNLANLAGKPEWLRKVPLMSPALIAQVDALYRRRIRSLQAVDRDVAALYAELRADGQLDNTYFVFTSDNGFHLGEYRLPAGKRTPYDDDIHVPFYVRGPGIAPGSHSDAIGGNVDLPETFGAIAGAKLPSIEEGRSLLDVFHGNGASDTRHAYLLEHWPEPQANQDNDVNPQTDGALATAEPSDIPEYFGVRTAHILYVEYVTGERELYDVATDPYELHNLAGQASKATLDAWHRYLVPLEDCHGQLCVRDDAQPPPTATK
jgi:arylsulfatase A-like enzyme